MTQWDSKDPSRGLGRVSGRRALGLAAGLVRGLPPRAMGPPRAFRPGRSLRIAGLEAPFPPRLLPAAPLQPPPGLPVPCDPALSQGGPAAPHDLACTRRTSHEPRQALPGPAVGPLRRDPPAWAACPSSGSPRYKSALSPVPQGSLVGPRVQEGSTLHKHRDARDGFYLTWLHGWLQGRDAEDLGARVYGTRAFICISSWAPQPSSLGLPGPTASPSLLPQLQPRPFNPLTG